MTTVNAAMQHSFYNIKMLHTNTKHITSKIIKGLDFRNSQMVTIETKEAIRGGKR